MKSKEKVNEDVQDVDHVKFKANRLANRVCLDKSLFCHTGMLKDLLRTGPMSAKRR